MSPSLVTENEGARQPGFTKSAEEPTWITFYIQKCTGRSSDGM